MYTLYICTYIHTYLHTHTATKSYLLLSNSIASPVQIHSYKYKLKSPSTKASHNSWIVMKDFNSVFLIFA